MSGRRETTLRVVGAGCPRTGTSSLRRALETLLAGPCLHMSAIPGHPFDLGEPWAGALEGVDGDWEGLGADYRAAVDWPASLFWRELLNAHPDAVVLLSLRDSPRTWWESANATILPVARRAMAPSWEGRRDLIALFERFTGTSDWDHPATLMQAYARHNDEVRAEAPADRLLEWRAQDGWEPLCRALGMPVPEEPFPWRNRRSEWP